MTCFVPSLEPGQPFLVSIHSWSPRPSSSLRIGVGSALDQVWCIRVIVDGVVQSMETFPSHAAWPQIVTHTNITAPGSRIGRLCFPRFRQQTMFNLHWIANDDTGRVKVELSEGCIDMRNGSESFVKTCDNAIFNFQPAPIGMYTRWDLW